MSRKRPTECGPAHALARRGSFGGKSPANRLVAWKSSKPVRSGSPRLTRFDSGAAPFPVQTHDCNDRRYRTPLASEVRARTPLEPHREPRRNFRRPAQVRWGAGTTSDLRRAVCCGDSRASRSPRPARRCVCTHARVAALRPLTAGQELALLERCSEDGVSFARRRLQRRQQRVQLRRLRPGTAARPHTAPLASLRHVPQRRIRAPLLRDRARTAHHHSRLPRLCNAVTDPRLAIRRHGTFHVRGVTIRKLPDRVSRRRARAGAHVGRARGRRRQASVHLDAGRLLAAAYEVASASTLRMSWATKFGSKGGR